MVAQPCVLLCLFSTGSSDNSLGLCLVSQTVELTAGVQMVVHLGCAWTASTWPVFDQCIIMLFEENTKFFKAKIATNGTNGGNDL